MSLKRSRVRHAAKDDVGQRFNLNRITATLLMSLGAVPAWADSNNITLHNGSFNNGSVNGLTTATSIKVNGAVTDITTGSVRGSTGFNSFGNFTVGKDNTVNVYVPPGASNLVNLVQDSQAVVNGTLNGMLMDGKIGGNIIFADPQGMVVGANGVINVGSLTVTTPSATQMQALARIAANGTDAQGNQAAADLIAGKYAGGSGSLEVSGKVNASGSVNLFAAAAAVKAGAQINAGVDFADAVFRSTVNVSDAMGSGVARQNGSIQIVADKTVAVSGELAALMADNSGASVHVKAGKSISLDGDARIVATGKVNKAGGQVTLEAPSIKLNDSAKITTSTTGSGTAGDITLTAYSDVSVSGTTATSVDQLAQQLGDQAQPLLASNVGKAEVVIAQNATLDAGQMSNTGKRGTVSITAFGLDKQLSGYADASGSIEVAGQITAKDILLHASSEAMISNTLLGSLFSSGALADDFSALRSVNNWSDAETWAHIISTLGDAGSQNARASNLGTLGLDANNWSELAALMPYITVAIANANASVKVDGSAVLDAAQNIDIVAKSTRTVDTGTGSIPGLNGKLPFNLGVAYGRVSGSTDVSVANGARLTSGSDLAIQALSADTLKLEVSATNSKDGNGSQASTSGLAFGMAHSEVTTVAEINHGAILSVGRDTSVASVTEQTLSNDVTFKSLGQGAEGGPAIALTLFDSTTRAVFDADLAGGRNLSVSAVNLISEQSNSASVQAGNSAATFATAKAINTTAPISSYLVGKIKSLFNIDPETSTTAATETNFRAASAIAIGLADHTAQAILGSNGSAPSLSLTGDLTVQALQRESDLHNSAESSVYSKVDLGDTTKTALSVAAAYNQLNLTTQALIGDGVNATAARFGVGAYNQQLLDLEGMDRWSSLGDVFTMLKNKASGITALPGELSTNFANGRANAEDKAITGAVTVMVNSLDATAWVGDNVTLNATGNDTSAWSSTPLAGLATALDKDGNETQSSKDARALSFAWDGPLSVRAATEVEQLSISGNFWTTLLNTASSDDGTAAGGAVNVQVTSNRTVAGIGAGGQVTAKAVNIDAQQDELILGISPSGGKGASAAGNGAVVVSINNATVTASINNSTSVDADQVTLNAEHHVGMWTAAGAIALSQNNGVGASAAVNVLTSDVEALVGGNQLWRPDAMGVGASTSSHATWTVDEVLLNARSDGQAGAFGVAGASAKSEEEKKEQAAAEKTNGGAANSSTALASSLGEAIGQTLSNGLSELQNGLSTAKTKATEVKDAVMQAPETLMGYVDKLKALVKGTGDNTDPGTKDGLTLAVAGSVGVNVSRQKTRSQLGDIVLDPRDPDSTGNNVTVQALNQTHQLAGAGGGAFTLAGGKKSETSSAIAGAIAYDYLANTTEALVQNSTLNGNHGLTVSAITAGDQVAMGLGLSVATGGQENTAVALSGSAASVTNITRAAVVDSKITQRGSGSVEIAAYDRSRLLIGGGAFAGSNGTGTSAGVSLTVGVLANKVQAEWLGSSASGFGDFDLAAVSATRVLAGALAVAASSGDQSGAGSGALFALVVNNNVEAKAGADAQGNGSSLNGGAVTVQARSASNDAVLDALISSAANATLANSGLDLDGSSTAAGINGSVDSNDNLNSGNSAAGTTTSHDLYSGGSAGEAILGIAGSVAGTGGKSAAGGAVGVVYTGSVYAASVANTDIGLSGDLSINAQNDTQVLAAAIGAAGGKSVGVSGSATAVIGRGDVSASLDMSGRTLTAHDLTVTASKSAGSYSLAGNIAASTQSASVGAAVSLTDMEQSASATVAHGTYLLGGDATVTAAGQSRILSGAISVAASGEGSAVGGALTYNRISDTTQALLDDASLKAVDLSVAASQPGLGASIWSMAVNVAGAGGSAGVGGAIAVNLIDAKRSASVSNSTVNLSGNASLTSAMDGEIWGMGVNGAGGSEAGVGGSVVVNNISGGDTVSIDSSTVSTTGSGKSLSLDASGGNGLTIASLAGAISGSGNAAVGGAISVNRIGADRSAVLNDTDVSGFASNSLKSGVDQHIYAIAVAGSGGDVAVSGSSTTNILSGTERASITGGRLDGGSLTLSSAEGDRTLWSLAGAISGAGSVAVGFANANNVITATREAAISKANLTLNGALAVQSGGSATIRSAAVGAGGAGTAAVGASIAVNVISGKENASLDDVTLSGATAVSVDATRGQADIQTLAGNVQGAGTGAGAGAVAVSTVDQQRNATVNASSLSLASGNSGIVVKALTSASIKTLALSGAGAGTGAAVFSNTSNNIAAVTHADVQGSSGSASTLTVSARDTSNIDSLAGGAVGAGSVAVGVATAVNRIADDIQARLTGSLTGNAWAVDDLTVAAASDASIQTASISAGFSGTAAVSAGVATNLLQTSTKALIEGGAQVVAQNNVGVIASDRDVIRSAASVVAGSGNAAVSGLVTVNLVQSTTEAGVSGATTRVNALGNGQGLAVDDGTLQNAPDPDTWADAGQFNPVADLKTNTQTVHGLAVRATSLQQVGQLSLSAAVSLVPIASAAVSGLSNTSVIAGSTTAYVDDASINATDANSGANAAQQVSVGAASHSFSFGGVFSGALSLGAAAVAASIDTAVVSRDVTARLSHASVNSRGETDVQAKSTRAASDIVAGAGGGIVGVAGSGGVLLLKGSTQALVTNASVLDVGALNVAASAVNKLSPNAGSVSGGAVGVGASIGVGYNQSTVRAWVGQVDTTSSARTLVNTFGAVSINADSRTTVLANAASISGGGAAVAGASNIVLVENVTEAGARYVNFGSSTQRVGSLTILASDTLKALLNGGSLAVGGISFGGSADVLVTNNATRAELLDSAAWLSGPLAVNAMRSVDVSLNTVTGGASASASIGGALGLLLLGSGAVEQGGYDAMGELDHGGSGTLSLADSLGKRENADTAYQATSVSADGKVSVNSASADAAPLDDATQTGSVKTRFASSPVYRQETVARLSNATVDASGTVSVSASDLLSASNAAGSAQVSGVSSIGAAAAFTFSNAHVAADILGGSLKAASLTLTGSSGATNASQPAVSVTAYNGAAGMGAGLGAALAIAVMNNNVASTLGGTLELNGSLKASLSDDLGLSANGIGATLGAVGAGVVVAVADRNSSVGLSVQDAASLSAQTIELTSEGKGSAVASGIGAAGGLLGAGNAVVVVATDSTSVSTVSGNHVSFNAGSGGLTLSASALPDVSASAIGAALGGLAGVGASVATATGATTVHAALGDDNQLLGNNGLTLSARLKTPAGSAPSDANIVAKAIAGSGGLYFSANATVATASNRSQVSAITGANLQLPGGRIDISADSATHQYADALGIAVSGGLAVGAAVASASADTDTYVTLGNSTAASSGVTLGDVVISATGNDLNQAKSVAGSGGLVAGNASLAITHSDGTADVTVGSDSVLTMDDLSLTSSYTGRYGTHADSVNAALVGASGAGVKNTVNGASTVTVSSNAALIARQDLLIEASNHFYTQQFSDVAVSGAGGGVISGQAVVSDTTITGNTLVDIAQNARLIAGIAPTADIAGKLMIRAYTQQATSEDATLSTGGVISGGGAENNHTSTLNNTLRVGNGALLSSYGELGLGTYSLASAAVKALVSTWGVAGVGVAKANVRLTSNQNIEVADNALIEALGSIALQAGQDPEGLWQTRLSTNASAQSVVRGLIAIPYASAGSHIVNNTALSVAGSAQVLAARNITVGGFNGYNDAVAEGIGRGYELGFIPVTNKDSSADATRDSHATLNGTLLAGRYNELVIDIDANGTLTQSSGLPVLSYLDTGFVPTAYLDSISGIDAITKQILRSTLASDVTGAWRIGPMMAAGGNITVQADRLEGSGSLTANGGPKIQVTNNSSYYLLLGSAVIPDDTGGNVFFTGGANATTFGASKVHQVNTNQRAQLIIKNTWGGNSGNVNYGPAIFLTGDLYNLSGLIHITNAKGSLGQFASTYGQQVLVEVPEGSMSVFQPYDYWPVGSNPISEWSSFADINWSTTTAVELIANAYYGSGKLQNNNSGLLYQSGVDNFGGQSTILFGGCLPASLSSSGNCSGGIANSYTGSSTQFHGIGNAPSSIPLVPILTLQKSATSYASASLTGSQASERIVGGQVGIQAKYIDINGTISSGQATTRTLNISTGLDSWLSSHYCASHGCTSLVDIPDSYLTSSGGTLIHARYDFVNKRIVVDDVNASGGGFVYLKGGIISTNQLGNILVNNGYGQVTITNQSNAQMQLGNIDTGTGSIGIVQIVDTLKTKVGNEYATTWYVDTQGQGLSIYDNRNGASGLDNAYLVSASTDSTAQYDPKSGIRYQWSQTASLFRNVNHTDSSFAVSDWVWRNPANFWSVADGNVVDGNGNKTVYQRDINGSFSNINGVGVAYHGCGDGIGSNCNWDFTASAYDSGTLYGGWLYNFPTSANITVTQSVKADNPFNISFVGNSTGSITATSNASLVVGGKISSPVGTTTLTTGGNLTSLSGSSVYAHDLVLSAAGSVGDAASAFNASLADGGTVKVSSGNAGINLSLGSSALIASLNAGNGTGDILVNAVGDLLAANSASNRSADVLGRDITLNSSTGSIGTSGNALRVNAVEVTTAGGGTAHGVVSAQANRAINLEETTGDMWVGQIASTTSDVWVKVDQGSLYDSGRRSSQTVDDSTQQAIWQKLALTAGYGAADNITATSIKPFEDQVNANYREYWSLLDAGSVNNGVLTLSTVGLEMYRPLVAIKLNLVNPSDAQVASYATERYSVLTSAFNSDIGSDWRGQTAFHGYDKQFSYASTEAQKQAFSQDAVWTEGELLYAIDKAALGAASGSSVGVSQPNISGRNVNLQVAGSLGQLADALTIDFNALRNGALSATEAAALAVATAPGDVTVNRDGSGNIQSLSVNRTLPFYVNASGQFDLTAGGSAYLQSQPDLNVGSVTVGGDSRLSAGGSILAASGASGTIDIAGNLTLQSTNGSLGTAGSTPAALNLNVGGSLLAASAGHDIALNWLNGDFVVGQMYALGGIYLNAVAGSLLQHGSAVTVNARDIRLLARDAIGSAGEALQLELQSATTGVLSGSAGDGIWISTDKALSVSDLQAGKGLSLSSTSTSGLTANKLVADDGDLTLDIRGMTRLTQARASGQVLVNSQSDVQLGELVQGGGLVYVNSQGRLSLDDGTWLKGANLQLRSDTLTVGEGASLAAGDILSNTLSGVTFGTGSQVNATGLLRLSNGSGGSSGDLFLGEGASVRAATTELLTDAAHLSTDAELTSNGALTLTARSLEMAAGSLMSATGTMSLSTSGDMVLGRLINTGNAARLFVIDALGQITANGDGQANLIASGDGDSSLRAGLGIGSASRALSLQLPVLTSITADQGDIYLTTGQSLRGTTLDASHGQISVNATDASLDYALLHAQGEISVFGGDLKAGRVVADSGALLLDRLGNVNIADADIGGVAQLNAGNVILGRLHSDGDFIATASGDFTATTLSTDGALSLTASNANLGTTDVLGQASMTFSRDLRGLTLLTAGGDWILNARNANVADAVVGGDTRHQLSGELSLGSLQGGGDWTLQAVNASIGSARLQGSVQQAISGELNIGELNVARNWTLDGNQSTINRAQAGDQVVIRQSGLLNLGQLQGGSTLSLTGTDAVLGTATLGGAANVLLSGDLKVSDMLSALGTTLDLGSGSAINALRVTGDLALQVTHGLNLGRADVTGNAVLNHRGPAGTVLGYRDLVVGDTLTVSGAGDWHGDRVDVAQTASFDVGSADLGSLISRHGRLSLKAAGLFAADVLTSSEQDVDLAAGSADLGRVNAQTTLTALTDGNLTVGSGIALGNISLHTVSGSRGDIRFGAYYADPQSGFGINETYIKSASDIDILTDGNVYGGNAVADRQLRIVGRNLDFGRAQSLLEDAFLQATGASSAGEGNITGLVVDAAQDVGIIANGNVNMPTVKFGGTYSLKAGRDLNVGIGGDLNVTGDAIAGRDMTFTIGGKVDLNRVTAGRNISISSGEYINIAEDVTAGGNITLKAASGDITVGSGIVSTGVPYLGETLSGKVLIEAAGDITTPLIRAAAGSIDVKGHSLRLGELTALGSTDLLARGLIQVSGTSSSGGDQQWRAEQSIGFDRLLAQGQVLLDSLLDTRGGVLQAGQQATVNAGWRNGVASDASIRLDQAQAPSLSLWSGNLIAVADAAIGQSVDLHGQDIALYGRHTGSGELNLWVTGSGQIAAQRLDTRLDAASIVSPHLYAVNSKVVTSARRFDLQDAAYVNLLDLQTAQARVLADNLSPAFQSDTDVQLYELDKAFALKQDAVTSTTNAYVVHRRTTHQVLVPNFSEAHAPVITGVMVQGVSAARYGEQQASGRPFSTLIDRLLRSAIVVPPAGRWTPAQWSDMPADLRLNLNLNNLPQSENGVRQWDL